MTDGAAPLDDAAARDLARELVALAPYESLAVDGIDLAPALEQVIFAALRAGQLRSWSAAATCARVAGAVLGGLLPDSQIPVRDLLVILLSGVHHQVFAPVMAALARVAPSSSVGFVRLSRAARDPGLADIPRADRHMRRRFVPALVRLARQRSDLQAAFRMTWETRLGATLGQSLAAHASDALVRLGIEAVRLDSVLQLARPRVVAVYDEINAYARLLPIVARRHGALSLDLPHAEVANPHAVAGVSYDWMAVFGRRASGVLQAGGVSADRIVEVGAARFDALLRQSGATPDSPRRIVMAAQYQTGAMTGEVRAAILRIAVAAAGAVQPAIVQIRPHPVESPRAWSAIASTTPVPEGVQLRIADAELHELLPGAFALLTGWSNSVFEAVIAGVPAISAHVIPGNPPVSFAAEGIALQATSGEEAAAVATRLTDTAARERVTSSARERLEPHLGPIDGHAADRTAALINRLLELAPGSGSPHG